MKRLKLLFTVLCVLCGTVVFAHDFEVSGIYYNITNATKKTVAVTYKGNSCSAYSNEYTGNVVIPVSVVYNRTTYSVTSIGNDAFYKCSGLTSVVIGNSVTSIGNEAFYDCYALTSVTIGNSVTSIGKFVFCGCDALTSVTIGNSVTSIGESAFRGCSGLTSITIPNSVTSIGNYAFYYCEGLTSLTIGNSVTSIGESAFGDCTGLTSITIPNSVTSIGFNAFGYCSGLTSVTIGNSVTSIGSSAFDDCTGLKEVHINDLAAWCSIDFGGGDANPLYYAQNLYLNGEKVTDLVIPDGVTSIGESAFRGCTGLTSITISNSVTSIEDYAFYKCSGLTSVVIGDSVTSIGSEAFSGCSNLKAVCNFSTLTITKGSTDCGYVAYYADKVYNVYNVPDCSVEGDYIFGKPNGANTLVGYLGNDTELTLPTDYKGKSYVIGADAFYGNKTLTSIVIPNNVTSIGDSAFDGCTGLKKVELNCKTVDDWFRSHKSIEEVVIGSSVTSIGKDAFYGCSGLTSVTVATDNTEYDSRDNCNAIIETTTNTLVVGCKKTIIPNSVTSIGDYAFDDCGLTSITIPNSVTSIGEGAFNGCSGLKEVHINDLAAWCGISFYNGYANPLYYARNLYLNGEKVTDLVIPDGVTSIGNYAFYGCKGLTRVVIPNSVTSIGNYAFAYCYGLKSITIPNSVTSIGNYAFFDCDALTSITIPNSVTSIGEQAFGSCEGLTSITIPNSVTSIGRNAFDGCTGLKKVELNCKTVDDWFRSNKSIEEVVIGDSVTSIGYSAFSGCSGLTSIVIPNSVTNIGNSAFDGCSGLTSIVIPNSVTNIGNSAFNGCSGLTSVVIPNSVKSIGESAFSGCSGLTSIVIPNSVTSIGKSAFDDCSGLTSIVIPNSVTSIGNYAFDGCTGLTSVVIPNSVTSIGYNAFYNCSGLTSVVIGNSVTSIEEEAFYGCSGLTSLVIGNSVTSIGEEAFYGCSGLTSVVIPNSVTSIGNRAFKGCTSLKELRIEDGTKTLSLGFNYNNSSGIGQGLFYDCPLKNLYLGRNLSYKTGEYHGYSPFSDKDRLTSVTVGNSVTSISNNAFYLCSGLTSITIPNSVTRIADYAFYGCSSLTSIEIPSSVKGFGNSVFDGCTGLKEVHINNLAAWCGISFYNGYANPLYYAKNLYLNGEKVTDLVIPDGVTSIGNYAFYGCTGLTSVTIGNSVTSIGNYAFYNCTNLKTVYNYSNLTFTKGSTNYGYVAYYADKVYNTSVVPEEPEIEPLTAGKYYKIKNVATGLYLQVSGNNTNMTLQEKSDAKLQIFTLEDAGEGKFYIKSTDADNCYYAHATTWNFNATTNANNKTPFTIALLNGETNIYTLYQNVTNNVGLAGTDSSNAGAFVFCDKRAENNGKWAFEFFTDEDRIAAAMATLENAIANAESVLKTRAQLLTDDEKKAISAAVQTANDEKGNTNADVTAEIARLTALSEMVNNAVGDAIFVNAIDEISNAVCYTVSTESRGAWYSEASNLNSTGKLNIAYNITDNKQQFAFIKSPKTGNYYLYSVSEAKFVSKNGDYTTLTETPVQTITFLTGERTASYPWIIALNTADGEKQIAVSNTFEYGIITFYNDLADAGNTVRLEMVATFDATAALALINAYENGETVIEEVNVKNVNVIIYDLQGHRVKEITEGGIYIINGKKVLVK